MPSYLDVALKALTLHTEARSSSITLRIFLSLPPFSSPRGQQKKGKTGGDLPNFIRYWLPDMLKHKYVALRFIAQDAYERVAPVRITPAPDIITRVFMLFRGVAVGDLGLWEAASERAAAVDEATFWAEVVGVDAPLAANSKLFRILERGGMEVH